jgi:hypothetical protein
MSIILKADKTITVGGSVTAPPTIPKLDLGTGGPSVTLPKGAKGESVWQTLSPEQQEIAKPLPAPTLPDAGSLLKNVTRIALILVVAMIGVMAMLQVFPSYSFRGGGG